MVRADTRLEAQHVVVALPRGILYVAGVYAWQPREQAVAVAAAGEPAPLNCVARDPCAHGLRWTELN